MSGGNSARRAILRSIRDSLEASRPHDAPYAELHAHGPKKLSTRGIALPLAPVSIESAGSTLNAPSSSLSRFCACLEAVGGRWLVASNLAEARSMVLDIFREFDARRICLSDAPDVRMVMANAAEAESLEVMTHHSEAQLFDADAGVSSAQFAVAETGTLILESDEERSRLVSLIPPIHIALVRTNRLRERLDDTMAEIKGDGRKLKSRAITFITGPSRTADIEQMLVIGVHGPQRLFVIFIQQDESHPDRGE